LPSYRLVISPAESRAEFGMSGALALPSNLLQQQLKNDWIDDFPIATTMQQNKGQPG
jgi:hypothetical protein